MKSRTLRNKSSSTITVSSLKNLDGRPLVITAGGIAVVSEATFNHPVLRRYLGNLLVDVTTADVKTPLVKEERPTTPPPRPRLSVPAVDPAPEPIPEPIPEITPVTVEEVVEIKTPLVSEPEPVPVVIPEESVSPVINNWKTELLKGPGVTANNVDALFEKYASKEALANATRKDILSCGVTKSYVARLKDWAAE